MESKSTIQEMIALFENISDFANICVEINPKELKISHFKCIHTPYPFIIYWTEIAVPQGFSVKQTFAALFLIDLYYVEEWNFDELVPISALKEYWIPQYLHESREHRKILNQVNPKVFFDDLKWYMEQMNQKKELFENIKQKYQQSSIIHTFDNYVGNEYFGFNQSSAFFCDFGHYD